MIDKRKSEGKTNYKKRLYYIKSGISRIVIRKSLKFITAQVIKYETEGDKTLVAATTKELVKLGYQGFTRNTPSAYLLGLLIAKKAQKKEITTAILDVGFHNPVKGSIIFSFLKGVKDSGLKVEGDNSVLPFPTRIQGEHISEFAKLKGFKSKYKPEELVSNFNQVKEKIKNE